MPTARASQARGTATSAPWASDSTAIEIENVIMALLTGS
jgi:hypothetical protein